MRSQQRISRQIRAVAFEENSQDHGDEHDDRQPDVQNEKGLVVFPSHPVHGKPEDKTHQHSGLRRC